MSKNVATNNIKYSDGPLISRRVDGSKNESHVFLSPFAFRSRPWMENDVFAACLFYDFVENLLILHKQKTQILSLIHI